MGWHPGLGYSLPCVGSLWDRAWTSAILNRLRGYRKTDGCMFHFRLLVVEFTSFYVFGDTAEAQIIGNIITVLSEGNSQIEERLFF